jgi:hypothetical protein
VVSAHDAGDRAHLRSNVDILIGLATVARHDLACLLAFVEKVYEGIDNTLNCYLGHSGG